MSSLYTSALALHSFNVTPTPYFLQLHIAVSGKVWRCLFSVYYPGKENPPKKMDKLFAHKQLFLIKTQTL